MGTFPSMSKRMASTIPYQKQVDDTDMIAYLSSYMEVTLNGYAIKQL